MKSNPLISLAFTVLLSLAGHATEKATFITNLESGKSQTVITYGTSLTAAGAWVKLLKAELEAKYPGRCQIVNSAQSAMWSKWGVDNLDKRVIANNPDTVIIEFAINDAFQRYNTSVEQARTNLMDMIGRIRKHNPSSEIILMTMNPPIAQHLKTRPQIEEHYQMVRDVAKKETLLLIDHEANWNEVLKKGEDEYLKLVPDGLHPNPEGCEKIIMPELRKSLGMSASRASKSSK